MNLFNIIHVLWRDLFARGSRIYNPKRRQRRLVAVSFLIAMVFAVAFGVTLYELNAMGRF